MRGNPHAIAAASRAAPPTRVVLRGVVKEGSASRVGASLYERNVSVAEQIARGLRDRHHQLIRLVQIETGHLLEAP
jgi:hypothetical protein